MIEQIKTFDSNTLAIAVIDGFNETDEMLARKLFDEKLEKGFDQVNILIKIDEYKLTHTSFKAFFEDMAFVFKKFKNMGRFAIVGDSKALKALVPIDNFFYENKDKGRKEQYFDVSEMDEALSFVQGN